ncbi:MAG TPA: MAPEG family protein [Polyangiaceae bacterium]|nr:MAPEG family protein [Polyangiaceae bacterium]
MSVPICSLLAFACWTLFVLMTTIGGHRWWQILRRRAAINAFPADGSGGPDWYQRATRAHLNCVENLPVFGAIVGVATWTSVHAPLLDALAALVVVARVCQTTTHVVFVQTARAVSFRFGFFLVQLVAKLGMVGVVIRSAVLGTPG